MEEKKKPAAKVDFKRQIALKTKELNNRINVAKNDFQLAQIFIEMIEVIEAEIFQWVQMFENQNENENQIDEQTIEEANLHITDLEELVIKIKSHLGTIKENAQTIQQAMINSHQLKEKVLKFPE